MDIFGKHRINQLEREVRYLMHQNDIAKSILADLQVAVSKSKCNFVDGGDYPLLGEFFGHIKAIEEHLGIKIEEEMIPDPSYFPEPPRTIKHYKAIKK